MRFLVPPQQTVPDEAIERAYLAGTEWIPWRGTNRWGDDGTPGEFILERSEEESGNLYFPWQVDGFGELTLATASLMERSEQYRLDLELARGVVNRLRNQVAEWEGLGLQIPPEFFDRMAEASNALIDSVIGQADDDVRYDRSTTAIKTALEAGDWLAEMYTTQTFAARHEQVAQLSTMLGAVLASDAPEGAIASA